MKLDKVLTEVQVAQAAGDVGAIEAITRRLIGQGDALQGALHAAGQALLHLGALDLAIETLRRAYGLGVKPAIANDLGVALQRSGQIRLAVEAYAAALLRRPDHVEATANLAAALFLLGEHRDALRYAQAAYRLAPAAAGVTTTLALVEGAVDGFERTIERLDRAAESGPEELGALTARIYALRRLERTAEARDVAERLVARSPDPRSIETLAMCRRDLGEHREALALLDATIPTAPQPATMLANAGEILLDLGDKDRARERFRRAVEADPGLVNAWSGLSLTERFATGAPEIDAMERLLETPALQLREERILLYFALGRAHRAAGNDARAFACFAEGNRLRRIAIAYDVADDERRMEAIATAVDAATIDRLRRTDGGGGDPILVMGMPRSGTSLVEQILASVPHVHGAGETPFARLIVDAAGPYPAMVPALDREAVTRLGDAYAEALASVTPPGSRTIDKMPSNALFAGLLHAMAPRARLVFCTRDPLDNGLSLYTALFSGRQDFAYDLAEIGRYQRAHAQLLAHWRRALPADAFTVVAYEDVVNDFDATVARLLAFCGLPWDDAVRRFHETPRSVTTSSRIEVRQPLYRSSLGGARRYAAYLEPLVAALG